MGRRWGKNYKNINECGIEERAGRSFNPLFANVVRDLAKNRVKEHVSDSRAQVMSLVAALDQEHIKKLDLKLTPETRETNFEIVLPIEPNNLAVTFRIEHQPVWGKSPYPRLSQHAGIARAVISQSYIESQKKHYSLFGVPFNEEQTETLHEITKTLSVLHRELPPWIQQFQGQNESTSVAAFYASPIRHWLAFLNIAFTAYQRRPRAPYEVAMSAELNTALTITLQLAKAKQDADNEASQA